MRPIGNKIIMPVHLTTASALINHEYMIKHLKPSAPMKTCKAQAEALWHNVTPHLFHFPFTKLYNELGAVSIMSIKINKNNIPRNGSNTKLPQRSKGKRIRCSNNENHSL